MERTAVGTRAAKVGVSIDSVLVGFQVALAAGAPWGAAAWGGAYPGALPPGMRVASGVSAVVWTGVALLTARRGGLQVPALVPDRALAPTLWGVTGLTAVSAVLNLITPSAVERALWGPVAVAGAVALGLTAAWGPGARGATDPTGAASRGSLSRAGRAG